MKNNKVAGRRSDKLWDGQEGLLTYVIPQLIIELRDEDLRENALRCLSGLLHDQWENNDKECYMTAAFYIFHSFGTMTILTQELIDVYPKLSDGDLSIRGSKRATNVFSLLQSVSFNEETRERIVQAYIPNYLFPFILIPGEDASEPLETTRFQSLSVLAILCQSRADVVACWAIECDLARICLHACQFGQGLSQEMATFVLELLMQHTLTFASIYQSEELTKEVVTCLNKLVQNLATDQNSSARLLAHVLRCEILLCGNSKSAAYLATHFPRQLEDKSFAEIAEACPSIAKSQQLCLSLVKLVRRSLKASAAKGAASLPQSPLKKDRVVGPLSPSRFR